MTYDITILSVADEVNIMTDGRGFGVIEDAIRQNLTLIFGAKPEIVIDVNSPMVQLLCNRIMLMVDRCTLSVRLPDCWKDLTGDNLNFEMIQSQTIRPLVLHYRPTSKMISDIISLIFITTKATQAYSIFNK